MYYAFAIGFFIFNYAIAVFFKKKFAINYDKRTLVSTLIFLLIASLLYFYGDIQSGPLKADTNKDKALWIVNFVIGTFATIQFVLWVIYSFLRKYNLIRLPRLIFNVTGWIIVIIESALLAKYYFHIDLAGFLITSTVISAIIGLSVQDTLTNLFAGISLQSSAPYSIGDWVFLGGEEGKVVDQNWRSLTLLSRANHRIVLPNKMIAQEKIVNYSRPTAKQIHIFDVGLDYSHPPNEVKKILRAVLDDLPGITTDEAACPFIKEYADSAIIYSMKFWIDDYGLLPYMQDMVLSRLWYALRRKNIKVPYPISELKVQMVEVPELEEQHLFDETRVKKILRSFKYLDNLSDDYINILSQNIYIEHYSEGEHVITEGTEGDSMFFIHIGSADVLIKKPDGSHVKIAEKVSGEYFGEMSLLTGEKRTASIRASTDITVVVIDKKSFSHIIAKNEEILEVFFNSLESNKSILNTMISEFENETTSKATARQVLLNKIKKYLSIN